jgi:hypothetical protein
MTDPDRFDLDLLEPLGAVPPPNPEVLNRVADHLRVQYRHDTTASPARSTAPGRRWTRPVVPAAAAAMMAGALGVSLAATDHHGRAAISPATSPSAASLREAILTAFSSSASSIAYSQSVWTTSGKATRVVEVWTSPSEASPGQPQIRRQVVTARGQTVQDAQMIYTVPAPSSAPPLDCQVPVHAPKPPPIRAQSEGAQATDGRLIDVEYASRSWSDQSDTCIPVTQTATATQIRSTIASGDWRVVGHGDIDGRSAVELALGGPSRPASADLLWVDDRTFLPLRASATKGASSGVGNSLVTTYHFLADTPADRKSLVAPIPVGFTRTATPPPPRG